MSLYTDTEVQIAKKAVEEHGAWSPKWAPDAPLCIATDVLPVVAPAIAARALREAADRYASFTRPDSGLIHPEWTDGFMEALDGTVNDLRARADEIEAGQP